MNDEFPGFGQQSGPDVKRLLLAGLLMSAVLMVFNQFFVPAPKKIEQQASQVQPPKIEQQHHEAQIAAPVVPSQGDPSIIATPALPLIQTPFEIPVSNKLIDGDPAWPRGGYQLSADNAGGKISTLAVFGFKQPISLIEGEGSGIYFLKSRGKGVTIDENGAYEVLSSSPREIVYQRTTPEGLRILRRYRFTETNYLLQHEIEIENKSGLNQRLDLDLVFKTDGKIAESSYFSPPANDLNFLTNQEGKVVRHTHSDLLSKSLKLNGPTEFIALEHRYFLLSILPKKPSTVSKISADAEYINEKDKTFHSKVTLSLKPVELAPNSVMKWAFDAYAGPKQLGLLKEVGHGLEEAVNFGWFGVISRPLLWLLVKIFGFVHNFGIAIILLTLLIKALTFPLQQKSFVSMQQMKKIAPDIKALEKKFGHDRTTLSQKQMELYKEKGVNPMAGCLPMFLQFPVWIAFYQMLSNSIEIYQKPFAGWLMDLTQPDPYYVLPLLMGITMVIQQLLQPMQDDQKAMKYAMLAMPVLFTFIMLNLPSGLSLYMFTNNILSLIQQMLIKRRFEVRTA